LYFFLSSSKNVVLSVSQSGKIPLACSKRRKTKGRTEKALYPARVLIIANSAHTSAEGNGGSKQKLMKMEKTVGFQP